MVFSINLKKGGPIDASEATLIVDKLGMCKGTPCLTLTSGNTNEHTIVAFDSIKSVTIGSKTVDFDPNESTEVLVDLFTDLFNKFDSTPVKVTFTNADNSAGTEVVSVARRSTIGEAIAKADLKVEGNGATYTLSPDGTVVTKDTTTQVLKDISIAVEWVPVKVVAAASVLSEDDGQTVVDMTPPEKTIPTTTKAPLVKVTFNNVDNKEGVKVVELEKGITIGQACDGLELPIIENFDHEFMVKGKVANRDTVITKAITIDVAWIPIPVNEPPVSGTEDTPETTV